MLYCNINIINTFRFCQMPSAIKVSMFHFNHFRKQNFLNWCVFLLCAIFLSAQVLEAEHASEPNCDEHLCLLCQANIDDENHCSRPDFSYPTTFTELFLALISVMLDKTFTASSPIRAPPNFPCKQSD